MPKTTALWLLLCLHTFVHAQTATVLDNDTGQPLALVSLSNNGSRVLTDAEGRANITLFQTAETITATYLGYQTQSATYADLKAAQWIIKLQPEAISLDQVVVSATRWNQNKRDVPARITSISKRDVALQNPQTAADMLGNSGEVFIQKSQQGGGSPMIRGFSTNRLLYAIDGVRMNTAIFRSGNIQNVISIDPFAVENAEVLFGPGSVIYGSDAIGGVMSFRTLTPHTSGSDDVTAGGSAVARYATANQEKTAHFDTHVGWKRWAMVTSFTGTEYGDLRMGAHGPDDYLRPFYVERLNDQDVTVANPDQLVQTPTGYGQINLMQKVRFRPNERWDLQYGLHYSTTTDFDRYDRLIRTRSNGTPRSAEWYYGPQVWLMNNFTATHLGKGRLYDEMNLRFGAQQFEESRHERDYNVAVRYNHYEKVYAYSCNADFLKNLGDSQKLLYGLEWVLNDVNSTGVDQNIELDSSYTGPSRYPQSEWSSYAAYASYQIHLADKMVLQTGARYNLFALNADFSNNLPFYPLPFEKANINDGALTGSVGLVYRPTDAWALSVNASTGFRAPNVDDVGKVFDSEPGSVVVPNPDLVAEYAYNAEIGAARVFGGKVKLDVTAFYTLLNNAIVRRDYTLNGQDSIVYNGELSQVQAEQNAARAAVYGLQAGLEMKLPRGFGISSQFNYQQGKEELDSGETSPSRHAAPWFGITRVTYHTGRLDLQLYGTYSGEVSYENLSEEGKSTPYLYALDENGNPYAPSWYTLNLKAMVAVTDHWQISAGVENLTDQRYRPYSSGLTAAGRNVVLSLRGSF